MADTRALPDEHAHGGLRSRGGARGGGDDDARAVPLTSVVVYHAQGCHLCERALEVVGQVRRDVAFELQVVDIGGDSELEARYRAWLPVVEIDGERAFTYVVPPESLRARLS